MIWDRVNTEQFGQAYGAYLLSLNGAIHAAAQGLQASPINSIRLGAAAVNTALHQAELALRAAVPLIVTDAVALAAESARGLPSQWQERVAEQASDLQETVAGIAFNDAVTARRVIRNQALTYASARPRLNHAGALLLATGEAGGGVFAQLDRAQRQIGSPDFALGHVRMAAAQAYLESFLALAAGRGAQTLLLLHPDAEPERHDLANGLALAELFHPNTRYTLSLET